MVTSNLATMKIRTLLLAAMAALTIQSCSHDEIAIQRMLDQTCSECGWRIESITDTVGYSIKEKCEALGGFTFITDDDLEFVGKEIHECLEQVGDEFNDHGGMKKRLLIAHCVSKEGRDLDYKVFVDKDGYYPTTDEFAMYLDLDKELGKKYNEYQLSKSIYDF